MRRRESQGSSEQSRGEFAFGHMAERAAVCVFAGVCAYALGRSVIGAAGKAFWFDEMCTWGVAHQAGIAEVWRDVGRAMEPNPPPFYLVEHFFGGMLRNEEVAYRLASILAFECVLVCVFVMARRRCGAAMALACSALLLLTIGFDRYAIDARPYSLGLACVAMAMVCYQRAPTRGWMICMGASLALAGAFHYYAVFALVPFAMAEGALWLKTHRARAGVWLALAAGLAPLGIFAPMLARVRAYFGPHFWAVPSLRSATDTYGWLFEASQPARATIAAILLLVAGLAFVMALSRKDVRANWIASDSFHEYVLGAGLVALPLIELVAARAMHGGMTARYALPAVLGVPLILANLAARWRPLAVAAIVVVALCAVGRHEAQFWASHGGSEARLVSPANGLEEILRQAGHEDLPVVVSNGLEYLSITHYAAPEIAGRLVALVDPAESVAETGNDSLDKGLLGILCCLPIRVYEYADFAALHPIFLLYSDGDIDFDRWPDRLMRAGNGLNIVAVEGSRNLYLVDLSASGR